MMAAVPAQAAEKGDCGVIVLPTGIGETAPADITAFNPVFAATAYNEEAGWMLFPSLLWVNRYAQIDWARSAASAITTPDNGTTYNVTLNPWKWSDGVPVTADDAVYYFNLIKQLGTSWPGYGQGGLPDIVKSIQITGPLTFTVVLKHQANPTWFMYNGIGQFEPLPKHIWSKYTTDQLFQAQSTPAFFDVVDGEVKIKKLDVGLEAIFVPNRAYSGRKLHFNQLVFKFLEGDGVAVQGVESGDTDAAMLPATLMQSVKNSPGTHLEILQDTWFSNVIVPNLKNPNVSFFEDWRVRQAMEDAIDQQSMISLIFHGAGDPAYGPFVLQPTTFLPPAMRGGNFPVGYNPAKARALLREAGYTPGADGIMQKNGHRLSFVELEPAGSDAIEEMLEFVQDDFHSIGVEMKIRNMAFNQVLALMAGPPSGWEAAGLGEPTLPYPTGEGQYATGAFQNLGGYSNATMDKLIQDSVTQPGLQNLFDYETYATLQQPVIFFAGAKPAIIVNNRLQGIANFVDPMGQFSPDQLYCTAPQDPKS